MTLAEAEITFLEDKAKELTGHDEHSEFSCENILGLIRTIRELQGEVEHYKTALRGIGNGNHCMACSCGCHQFANLVLGWYGALAEVTKEK